MDVERELALIPFKLALMTEEFDLLDRATIQAERFDGELAFIRNTRREGIEFSALGGESDVLGGEIEAFLEVAAIHLGDRRAFVEPRPSAGKDGAEGQGDREMGKVSVFMG